MLTDEKLLPGWIADASVDLRVGGHVELRFREEDDPEGYCKGENVSGGTILDCQPNQLLRFKFCSPHAGETILSYSLQDISGQTLFVLEHNELPPDLMVAFTAGWHSYLDALAARLRGEEPQPFAPQFELMIQRYAFVLAASSLVANAQPASSQQAEQASYQEMKTARNVLLQKYDRLCHDEDDLRWEIQKQKRAATAEADKELDYLAKKLKIKQSELQELELDVRDKDKAMLVHHS